SRCAVTRRCSLRYKPLPISLPMLPIFLTLKYNKITADATEVWRRGSLHPGCVIIQVMKKLKLDHAAAQRIVAGGKRSTWRLFDDKDLAVNDHVLLVDKADPLRPDTWQAIGVATIDHVSERRLGDMTEADMDGSEPFATPTEMLATYRDYYGPNVTWQ